MSKIWTMKSKVMCRDCKHLTAAIIIHHNETEVTTYCPVQEMMTYPDVEHFCDDFDGADFSRVTKEVKEREILAENKDVSKLPLKEGHGQPDDANDIDDKDIIGWRDADGNVHPMSELPGYDNSVPHTGKRVKPDEEKGF